MIKLILFDIDGTLLKNYNSIQVESYHFAIRQVFDIEAYLEDIVPDGKVDSQIFIEILSHRNVPQALAREHLGQLFSARYQYLVQKLRAGQAGDVLPGVGRLLSILKDCSILGIVTGNEERSAWHRLEMAGLRDYFITGAFGNESERRADLVKIAAERTEKMVGYGFSPSEILLVGDTPNDVLCAKENNAHVVSVATGKYSEKELLKYGPDLVLADLTQISEFQHLAEYL